MKYVYNLSNAVPTTELVIPNRYESILRMVSAKFDNCKCMTAGVYVLTFSTKMTDPALNKLER